MVRSVLTMAMDLHVFVQKGKENIIVQIWLIYCAYFCYFFSSFTGKDCSEDITDCKDNSCPPGATCIDLAAGFYCQCPFNLTGDDCRKSITIKYISVFK